MLQSSLVIIAGIFATLAMTGVLYFTHLTRMANGDMVRAIGSYITRSKKNALPVGLGLHIFSGILFVCIYLVIWNYLGFTRPKELLLVGTMFGFAHGIAVSIMMIIFVAEHHPLPEYRQVGFAVAVSHVFAHTVYGAMVGFLAGYLPYLLTT